MAVERRPAETLFIVRGGAARDGRWEEENGRRSVDITTAMRCTYTAITGEWKYMVRRGMLTGGREGGTPASHRRRQRQRQAPAQQAAAPFSARRGQAVPRAWRAVVAPLPPPRAPRCHRRRRRPRRGQRLRSEGGRHKGGGGEASATGGGLRRKGAYESGKAKPSLSPRKPV